MAAATGLSLWNRILVIELNHYMILQTWKDSSNMV